MSSSSSKSPAFQFYPSDFTGSGKVGVMTIDEVGAYTLLLCMEWDQGGFAYDEAELARFCRVSRTKFRKMWKRVSRCFAERDGRWVSPRLEAERAKQQSFREKQQAKANARWAKPGDSRGNAAALPGQCSPISNLQSPISTTEKTPPVVPPDGGTGGSTRRKRKRASLASLPPTTAAFEEAWEAYPPRPGSNKAPAWEAWLARLDDGCSESEMIGGAKAYRRWVDSQVWDDRRKILMAQTFFGPQLRFRADWSTSDSSGADALRELEELGAQDPWWTEGLRARRAQAA